jgi:hypothetical protein
MSNVNDAHVDHTADLPPFPVDSSADQGVCEIVKLYIAVFDDLSPDQQRSIHAHMSECQQCQQEWMIVRKATLLVADLDELAPSTQVDNAIYAALAHPGTTITNMKKRQRRKQFSVRSLGGLTVAAALVFIVSFALSGAWLVMRPQSFSLPANLTWNTYVLLQKQTMLNQRGESYEVIQYTDMTTQSSHVETVMNGKFDVVVIQDGQHSLGLDMMHHVAQWNVGTWNIDESMFDLQRLRTDLRDGQAKYLGKGTFQNSPVYRIQYADGDILLLDMHYMPVNVLHVEQKQGSAQPMYDTVQWLSPNVVSSTMWKMQVPHNFQMGKISGKP